MKVKHLSMKVLVVTLAVFCVSSTVLAQDIQRFLGEYVGSADVDENGTEIKRDMSVKIEEADEGFSLKWASTIHRADGRIKEKKYKISFLPTKRDGIYSSAMGVNVFGKAIALDPLKGDPYVWSRISGNTITVFSMLIDEVGGYEMQEYHRTLTDSGLDLDYRRVRNGERLKNIRATLVKE